LELTLRYPDSAIRRGTAASIVSCWEAIGVAVQETADDPTGFFRFPPGGNCENYVQFPVDVQLYTISFSGTDPEAFLRRWHSDEIPKPTSNQPPLDYLGPNVSRFHNEIYDGKVESLAGLDGQLRIDEIRDLDDYLVERVVIPLIHRKKVSLYAAGLWNSGDPATGTVFRLNPWDSEFWNIENWNKEEE
jgi:peptide/nickel transport system substrate-binding protein